MKLQGKFIRGSNGSRRDEDASRIEARVFSFFGFGLTIGAFDWTLGSPLIVTPIAVLALACVAPFLWYCGCYAKTFLGLGELGSLPLDVRRDRRRVLAERQCRRASAYLDALIDSVDVSLGAVAGSSVYGRGAFRSQNFEQAMLAEYRADYESWIVEVLQEAHGLGATIPRSVGTLLEGRNVSQLRALSSVLKEVEEELGS